jgi:hypothetical protein
MTTNTPKNEATDAGESWPDFDPHGILAERAATAWDVSNMTRISADMTREEVISKVMGIPLEDVPRVLAEVEADANARQQ